jgi:hypothetical protein
MREPSPERILERMKRLDGHPTPSSSTAGA